MKTYPFNCFKRTGVGSCKLSVVALIILIVIIPGSAFAEFPEKPLTFVVGFGIGGSADRMTRSMTTFLQDGLGQPIRVVNKKGASTQIAANYVLNSPAEGYTVFASTFNPYLPNTILNGSAKYSIDDFAFINAQWFDFELIATHKGSRFKSLPEILRAIKDNPKKVTAAVVQGSTGHLIVKIMLRAYGIPGENLNLVTYSSGGKARAAIAGGQVDFTAISAMGSEGIRDFLVPLAVVRKERSEKWNAPPINETLKPLGISVPVVIGSVRGFAVPMSVKTRYPERFQKLSDAVEKTLSRKDVQKFLAGNQIGGVWTGPEKTQQIMQEAFETFKKYHDLLKQ